MMNVVDPNILQRILTSSGTLPGAPAEAPQPVPPYMSQSPYSNTPPMAHPQHYAGPPMHMGAGVPPPAQPMHMGGGPPAGPPSFSNLPEDQRVCTAYAKPTSFSLFFAQVLLEQVLKLTPAEINALPPDQRQSIMQLKASIGQA